MGQPDLLRHELAEDDGEDRQHAGHQEQRDRPGVWREERDVGQRQFKARTQADPGKRRCQEADERDADLDDREEPARITLEMQDPTGPWVVSWYKETGKLGEIDNIVMAGHLDYWDVGPAVFYNIAQLAPKDPIDVTGDDGETYSYEVEYVKQYDAANAPIQEIIGPTDTEDLTLITCGGPFDYQNGVYLQRTVVRSHRIKS